MLTPDTAKTFAHHFIASAEREAETTAKTLAALPENQMQFKLGEKGRTAQELAWHLAAVDVWFAEAIAALQFNPSDEKGTMPQTAREIVAFYKEEFPKQLAKVKAMTPEQLMTPVDFYGVYNLPAVMYLDFLLNHSIHHRGQLSTYLRAMNAHVPSIYGGSADEPFEAAAAATS